MNETEIFGWVKKKKFFMKNNCVLKTGHERRRSKNLKIEWLVQRRKSQDRKKNVVILEKI